MNRNPQTFDFGFYVSGHARTAHDSAKVTTLIPPPSPATAFSICFFAHEWCGWVLVQRIHDDVGIRQDHGSASSPAVLPPSFHQFLILLALIAAAPQRLLLRWSGLFRRTEEVAVAFILKGGHVTAGRLA